jgi:hypothetical protein
MNEMFKPSTGSVAGVDRIFVDASPTTTTAAPATFKPIKSAPRAAPSTQSVEDAVYAHLQAMRVLGRTQIKTVDVARALGLPVEAVDATIDSLTKKGVKVA